MSPVCRPTILAIDGERASRLRIGRILNAHDYDLLVANSCSSALELASQVEIDLVLCDQWVDDTEGLHLLKQIHALPDRGDVPAIFLSTSQYTGVIRRCHDFGAAYHIKKPCQADVLNELIKRVLWLPDIPHPKQSSFPKPHFARQPKPLFPSVQIQTSPGALPMADSFF